MTICCLIVLLAVPCEPMIFRPGLKHNTVIIKSTINVPLKQWRYIDGDIITDNELANIKRNTLCPCNEYPTTWKVKKGKKFKQCCGK